jgi:putative drug exporter of the RND superfamily
VLGSVTDVSIYAINLTTALGLGLAIDYSLFIVSRFREELRAGRSVERGGAHDGDRRQDVLISALTVAVSLSALLVFPQYFLRSFAYAGVAVVLLALAGSLLSLPALLAVLGTGSTALRIGRRRAERAEHEGMWHRIATFVMRRPVPIAATVVAVLLLLGRPFLRVQFGTPDDRVLPDVRGEPLRRRRSCGRLRRQLGRVLRGGRRRRRPRSRRGHRGDDAASISAIDGVARVESAAGHVRRRRAGPRRSERHPLPDRRRHHVDVGGADVRRGVAQGEELVGDIRDLEVPLDIAVEGSAAELVDTKAAIGDAAAAGADDHRGRHLRAAVPDVRQPARADQGAGAQPAEPHRHVRGDGVDLPGRQPVGLLDFTATGHDRHSMPILMFCIAFGLSMDYEVFLLSRIKEEHDRTGDNEASVALGLERTGRIVTAPRRCSPSRSSPSAPRA